MNAPALAAAGRYLRLTIADLRREYSVTIDDLCSPDTLRISELVTLIVGLSEESRLRHALTVEPKLAGPATVEPEPGELERLVRSGRVEVVS